LAGYAFLRNIKHCLGRQLIEYRFQSLYLKSLRLPN
jgi:hypothetical protein